MKKRGVVLGWLLWSCAAVFAQTRKTVPAPDKSGAGVLQLLPQNPHYFLYRMKPLVIVGSGEHYGAVINRGFNYDRYLKTLQEAGLNATRLFTGAYFEKPGAFGIERNTMAPDDASLLLPWKKEGDRYNLTVWNEAYFLRLHDFMKKAAQNDVIVEVNLFSSYYGGSGWPYHPFHANNNSNGTPANLPANKVNTLDNGTLLRFQEAYVRKLVRELTEYDNVYFEIQNEPWADQKDTALVWNDYLSGDDLKQSYNQWKNTIEVVSEASLAWQRTVATWIAGEEQKLRKKHPVSQNVSNFKSPLPAGDSLVSLYTFHYAHPDAAAMNYEANKVIGFNETGFAGRKDETYRRQAWRFLMSGGGLFNHLDYSFTVGHEDGSDTANRAPGGGSAALRKSFGVLRKYIGGLELATLRPDKSFLTHAHGAFAYAMHDAQSRMVYIEPLSEGPARIALNLPDGIYLVEWTDVQSGETISSEKVKLTASNKMLFSPKGWADKVVKLKKI